MRNLEQQQEVNKNKFQIVIVISKRACVLGIASLDGQRKKWRSRWKRQFLCESVIVLTVRFQIHIETRRKPNVCVG
jgi:hypothetical protein